MKDKDRLNKELDELAPFLKSLRQGDDGHRVPPQYFENLESEVFSHLDAIGAKRKPLAAAPRPSLWQWLQSLWQPRAALAFAGVLVLALAAWWYFQPKADYAFSPELANVSITPEDAEIYLMDNLMELDPEQIAAVLPGENLPGITLDPPSGNSSDTRNSPATTLEIAPEDLEDLLRDMTDEELKNLLL
ncbi:MAG: hypothetical protein EP344_09745 [Bacteroidetes bacterium]|nr:MAG: hypothetical protein EP344_09745 [Bacteroidota bacterium]